MISDFAISEEKILNIIRSLNPNKAHGCDEMSVRMIKLSDDALVLPLSLLPIFGKILEKLVYDSLYSHLVSCKVLEPNQSGFRPGDSTVNQLLSITHTIFQAFDCNPPLDVRSVYLDISKTFDRCSDYCCGCCCFMLMAAEQGTVRPRGKEASWL